MVYNANLDKSFAQRKSLPELRAELKKWEEQQRTNAKKKEKEKEGAGEDVIGYQVCLRSTFLPCMIWHGAVWCNLELLIISFFCELENPQNRIREISRSCPRLCRQQWEEKAGIGAAQAIITDCF